MVHFNNCFIFQQWLEVKKQGKQEEHRFCHENFMSQKTLQVKTNLNFAFYTGVH